jgi:cellulose synthase (UDP-forming)
MTTENSGATKRFLIQLLSILGAVYMAYYIWWRAAATLNPLAPVFSWSVWFAESFGVVNYILFAWMTRNIKPLKQFTPARSGLTVDVFVPTYNEDLEILEATMIGCSQIRYPHTTYILDDGRRLEVAQLAARLGCKYLTREDNKFAKAGNLNAALKRSAGEFIVVLDADTVPQPDFLDRTLGYFTDPLLALVQLPQEFYNQDSIQHNPRKKHLHEQSLFFRVIQPGKNHSNSAFWTGSPSVLRRKAIEGVGGVATETITEDIHTSVRLHAAGWKTLFVNEVLAYGIAPQTIHAFLTQRLRWAQGTMQLYRSKDSPLWKPGLTFQQRVSYFTSFRAYIEAIQKLILILTPPIIILTQVLPMHIDAFVFLAHWTPYFLLTIFASRVSGRGYFSFLQNEKFSMLKMVIFLQSFLALLPFKLSFKVTPKSIDAGVYRAEQADMRIYMVLFGAIIGITFAGILKIEDALEAGLRPAFLGISIVWSTYNAGIILLALRDVLTRKHFSHLYRFGYKASAQLISPAGTRFEINLEDVSLSGVGFSIPSTTQLPAQQSQVQLTSSAGEYLVLPLRPLVAQTTRSGRHYLGAQFAELSPIERSQLFELLYIDLPSTFPDRGYAPTPQYGALP